MGKVAIVTDSTSYIPKELLTKYNINVAPQVLIWGEETYEDGVDIQPSEFYARLEKSKVFPTSSQVTPGSFHKIFSKLIEQDYEILAVLISDLLSGTISSATQAKLLFPGNKIEIVNSRSVAMGLGFAALAAARAASDGASLADCVAVAEKASKNIGVVFTVETLEYLHRGGRIGGAQKLLGTALSLKPILEVTGGRVDSIEKVRTRTKSLNRLVEIIEERIDGRSPVHLATIQINVPEEARQLLDTASKKLSPVETIFSEVSPVIGAHGGPGTVGLAFLAGT
jgi:DegV family protein with EDD domain